MKIDNILTQRLYQTWPSWHLVFEWEDTFNKCLNSRLICESEIVEKRVISKIPLLYNVITNNWANTFYFEMFAKLNNNIRNHRNMIPCIIDCYVNKERIRLFEKQYSKCKVVFVSSREVYNYLKANNCRLNLMHLPLSLPDKYKVTSQKFFKKSFDVVMMGRQNVVLHEMLMKYALENPSFNFVYERNDRPKFHYYTRSGKFLGVYDSRDKYFELMRQSKVALYSTPGIDGGENRTHGFNQVTPKFLEILSSGCHVIARYESNPDTDYYELSKFSKNITKYEDFKVCMKRYLNEEVDMDLYAHYLAKHYSSVRAKEMANVLSTI